MDEEFVDPNEFYDGPEEPSGSFDASDEMPKDPLHRAIGWLALLFGVIVITYLWGGPFWKTRTAESQPAQTDGAPAKKKPKSLGGQIVSDKVEEITGLAMAATEQFDWAKEEEIAANRSTVEDFKSKLNSISDASISNAEALALLQAKTESLRTSEEGAKIASDPKYVQQYIALREKVNELEAANPVAEKFANDMRDLLKRVAAANDTSYRPQDFAIVRATEFLEQNRKRASEIKRFENSVAGLIAATQEFPAGELLESAIKSELESTDQNLAESLATARAEAMAAAQAKLSAAEKDRIKAEADLKLAEIQAGIAATNKKREGVTSNAAKKKLEQEFNRDLNDINVYLLPFISEGRNMRGGAGGKGPVSFSAIKAKGALENTADGLSSLSHAAKNGRPLGEFPINIRPFMISNNSTEGNVYNTSKYRSIESYLEKAQSLLNKYGPLMVEKGMLAE